MNITQTPPIQHFSHLTPIAIIAQIEMKKYQPWTKQEHYPENDPSYNHHMQSVKEIAKNLIQRFGHTWISLHVRAAINCEHIETDVESVHYNNTESIIYVPTRYKTLHHAVWTLMSFEAAQWDKAAYYFLQGILVFIQAGYFPNPNYTVADYDDWSQWYLKADSRSYWPLKGTKTHYCRYCSAATDHLDRILPSQTSVCTVRFVWKSWTSSVQVQRQREASTTTTATTQQQR
jgi:hypothetical protein